jgi:hypothetical protein
MRRAAVLRSKPIEADESLGDIKTGQKQIFLKYCICDVDRLILAYKSRHGGTLHLRGRRQLTPVPVSALLG